MSETKHTPGLWKVFHESDFQLDIYGNESGRRTTHVATIDLGTGANLEERRANARLIAAAPELLEALEALRFMTQNGWITPEDKPTDWQLGWEAACEQFKIAKVNEVAEAAIRKAKGEMA